MDLLHSQKEYQHIIGCSSFTVDGYFYSKLITRSPSFSPQSSFNKIKILHSFGSIGWGQHTLQVPSLLLTKKYIAFQLFLLIFFFSAYNNIKNINLHVLIGVLIFFETNFSLNVMSWLFSGKRTEKVVQKYTTYFSVRHLFYRVSRLLNPFWD